MGLLAWGIPRHLGSQRRSGRDRRVQRLACTAYTGSWDPILACNQASHGIDVLADVTEGENFLSYVFPGTARVAVGGLGLNLDVARNDRLIYPSARIRQPIAIGGIIGRSS